MPCRSGYTLAREPPLSLRQNQTAIIDCAGSQLDPESDSGPPRIEPGAKIHFRNCQLLHYIFADDPSVANSTQHLQDSIVQDASASCYVRHHSARTFVLQLPCNFFEGMQLCEKQCAITGCALLTLRRMYSLNTQERHASSVAVFHGELCFSKIGFHDDQSRSDTCTALSQLS